MSFTNKFVLDEQQTHSKNNQDLIKRDNYKQFNNIVLQSIAIALNAPSAHNTQAWKFKILNDTEFLFYVDENKLLPETDPPARQIHISCGCFIEAICIGCVALEHQANVSYFPEGNYLLNDIGIKPVAKISLIKTDTKTHELWDYIFTRRMNRTEYHGTIISNEEHTNIIKNLSISSIINYINTTDEMKKYAEIFRNAMKIEFNTLAANEETRRMFRFNDEEAETKRDGLTFAATGISGLKKTMAQKFTKNTQQSWNSQSVINKGISNFNKGLDSAKGFVLFITNTNSFQNQIDVGRDFYRYTLSLAKNALYMHPLNQATQEYSAMDIERKKLDTLGGIKGTQKIQLVARIGRANVPFESFRKHLNDFLIK
jgi:hypothetical protein